MSKIAINLKQKGTKYFITTSSSYRDLRITTKEAEYLMAHPQQFINDNQVCEFK